MESELGREPLGPWLQEDGVGSLALPLAASLLLAASAVVCGPLGGGVRGLGDKGSWLDCGVGETG